MYSPSCRTNQKVSTEPHVAKRSVFNELLNLLMNKFCDCNNGSKMIIITAEWRRTQKIEVLEKYSQSDNIKTVRKLRKNAASTTAVCRHAMNSKLVLSGSACVVNGPPCRPHIDASAFFYHQYSSGNTVSWPTYTLLGLALTDRSRLCAESYMTHEYSSVGASLTRCLAMPTWSSSDRSSSSRVS